MGMRMKTVLRSQQLGIDSCGTQFRIVGSTYAVLLLERCSPPAPPERAFIDNIAVVDGLIRDLQKSKQLQDIALSRCLLQAYPLLAYSHALRLQSQKAVGATTRSPYYLPVFAGVAAVRAPDLLRLPAKKRWG